MLENNIDPSFICKTFLLQYVKIFTLTLIVVIECKDSLLLATDSRVTYDEILIRENYGKIENFGNKFSIATVGWAGGADAVVESIKTRFDPLKINTLRDFKELCEDECFNFFKRYKERMELSEDEDLGFDLVCASHEGAYEVHMDGTSDIVKDYQCFGSSDSYGEYILKQLYTEDSSIEQATQWAIYTIKQAMGLDPYVGGRIYVVHLTPNGIHELTQEEVMKIEQQISGQSPEFQRDLYNIVDKIVETRRKLNQITSKKYKAAIFKEQESSIWNLVRPVFTEEDFTNRVLSLGVLIDESSVPVKHEEKDQMGSIDALEKWLKSLTNSNNDISDIIKTLRQIRALRNKKLPVHPDDSEFISVVVSWGLTFPPDWAKLYIITIQKYLSSLEKLLAIIDKIPI